MLTAKVKLGRSKSQNQTRHFSTSPTSEQNLQGACTQKAKPKTPLRLRSVRSVSFCLSPVRNVESMMILMRSLQARRQTEAMQALRPEIHHGIDMQQGAGDLAAQAQSVCRRICKICLSSCQLPFGTQSLACIFCLNAI